MTTTIHPPVPILIVGLLLASLCCAGCSSGSTEPVKSPPEKVATEPVKSPPQKTATTPVKSQPQKAAKANQPEQTAKKKPKAVARSEASRKKAPPQIDPRVKKLEEIYRLRVDQAAFPDALRAIHTELPELVVSVGDQPLQWNSIEIARLSPGFRNGNHLFDAFRFRSPLDQPADLHWAFGVPEQVGRWYILPLKGAMQGFESYKNDWNLNIPGVPLPPGNGFVFQELMGGRILPGEEYIIWYKPVDGSPNTFHAALRLTPAGTHTAATTAEDIARILGVSLKPHEFPQTPAGLQMAFDTAARMTTRDIPHPGALRRVLGSVWSMLPEIRVNGAAGKPEWNHLAPDISFQFHAVRCRSPLTQPADMRFCYVVEHDALRSGVFPAQGELRGSHDYAMEINCPVSGTAFPTDNLTRFESLSEGQIVPDTEYVLWFAPERGAIPHFDLVVQMSPAGTAPTQGNARSIAAAIGFDIPEIPNSERVAATLRRCHLMAQDGDTKSWEFHRLIQFASPGLPVLEATDGPAQWKQIELNQNGSNFAAFRLVRRETAKGPLIVAVAKPLEPKMNWGFVYVDRTGIWPAQRRQEQKMSIVDLTLPPENMFDVDLFDDWDSQRDGPLVIVFAPADSAPLTFQVAAKADIKSPPEKLSTVPRLIDAMGFRLQSSTDPGGMLGKHDGSVNAMQFINDAVLATSSEDGTVRLWNTSDRDAPQQQRAVTEHVTSLAISSDRSRIACAIPNVSETDISQITIHDARTLAPQVDLRMPVGQSSQHVSFSPDGRHVLACDAGSQNGRKSVLCVWDLAKGGPPKIREFENLTIVRSAHWLPDSKTIVTAGVRSKAVVPKAASKSTAIPRSLGEILFLDSETLETKDTLTEIDEGWMDLAISEDGTRIAAIAYSGLIMIWNAATRTPIASLVQENGSEQLSLSADGSRLVTLTKAGAVRLWDVDSHKQIRKWPAQKPEIRAVAIAPNGKALAFGGIDHQVRLFAGDDLDPSKNEHSPKHHIVHSIKLDLVLIPAGKFVMGVPEHTDGALPSQPSELPVHRVQITRPFCMGVHEVTVAQFRAFVEATGYRTTAETSGKGGSHLFTTNTDTETRPDLNWRNPGFTQTDDHPVVQVSWHDAVAFCEWLTKTEGKRYRLPTEAEWEYACRAGTSTRWYFGDYANHLTRFANVADEELRKVYGSYRSALSVSDGHAFTAPIGSYIPNEFGLYDTHGNVWEWCNDWFNPVYYSYTPPENPAGPGDGKTRVQRGGGFLHIYDDSESGHRDSGPPDQAQSSLGFRVVQEIP
jgi:formylglycine-generating enzyme required for sulfatase activity